MIIPFLHAKKLIPFIKKWLPLITFFFFSSSSAAQKTAMEDRNILAADCIVLCCCCQCMMLQILIFILLKLPHKLMKKMKQYAKKLRARRRATKIMQIKTARNGEDSFPSSHVGSLGAESLEFGCCMSEIERILDDLSSRGEFAFGSFWGGGVASDTSFPSCLNHDQLDYEVVGYRLMELFGAANFSSQHWLIPFWFCQDWFDPIWKEISINSTCKKCQDSLYMYIIRLFPFFHLDHSFIYWFQE